MSIILLGLAGPKSARLSHQTIISAYGSEPGVVTTQAVEATGWHRRANKVEACFRAVGLLRRYSEKYSTPAAKFRLRFPHLCDIKLTLT